MVTDEMMKRAIEAYAKDTGAEGFQLEGWIEPAIRAALDAALSAAEPVRWMWEERRFAESDIWDDMYDDEPPAPHKHVRNIRPLYAAPPAPSVAVKALTDAYKAGFDASSQGYNGETFPEYEADSEWLAQRDSDLSALSAQVQDVAGWQPIETAPKDGRTILAYFPLEGLGKDWERVMPVKYRESMMPEPWIFAGRAASSYSTGPTHWMPLPAVPAKQED